MSLSGPYPPPRRPILIPVLVAALFLAVIGASVGFVLGDRRQGQEQRQAAERGGPVVTQTTPELVPSDGGTDGDGDDEPDGPTDADPCPPVTVEAARRQGALGDLTVRLYLRTRQSEVWICVDGAGTLFYQGQRGKPGGELVLGKNALFLTDIEESDGGYVARNTDKQGRTTTYRVSESRLVITHPDGSEQEEPAA